jgi:hypothetical protein
VRNEQNLVISSAPASQGMGMMMPMMMSGMMPGTFGCIAAKRSPSVDAEMDKR